MKIICLISLKLYRQLNYCHKRSLFGPEHMVWAFKQGWIDLRVISQLKIYDFYIIVRGKLSL